MYRDPTTSPYPEDDPAHPDHDPAVTKDWAGDKRKQCALRSTVDDACKGLLPHIQERIKDVARRAYYLGSYDGMQLERETRKSGEAA